MPYSYLVNPSGKGNRGSHCDRIAASVAVHPNAAIPLAGQQDSAVVAIGDAALCEVTCQSQLPVYNLPHQ